MNILRKTILNIWVDGITRDQALEKVRGYLEYGKRAHGIFASNPEKNYSVPRDPELYRIYRDADILLPDGIGMVLALRILHGIRIRRIPGSEFIFDICALAESLGKSVFVYGAKDDVNERAVARLGQRFPGLRVAGRSSGYVKEEAMEDLIRTINESGADVLFLALGSPRQEKWFARHHLKLEHVKVCQGVGGTLDTLAGTVKRAPKGWCRLNLEWLYRLLNEPSRIDRQKVLPVFAADVFGAWSIKHMGRKSL